MGNTSENVSGVFIGPSLATRIFIIGPFSKYLVIIFKSIVRELFEGGNAYAKIGFPKFFINLYTKNHFLNNKEV